VKFKIDENLPAETAETLHQSGFVADTVADEDLSGSDGEAVVARSRSEDRILVTLDLDFANIRAYPPGEHSGIIVLRLKRQDKATALGYVRRLATALADRSPRGELWIVDSNRIRFRQGI
jgi:predicted nuclease of predicted toxin-antitoxin system